MLKYRKQIFKPYTFTHIDRFLYDVSGLDPWRVQRLRWVLLLRYGNPRNFFFKELLFLSVLVKEYMKYSYVAESNGLVRLFFLRDQFPSLFILYLFFDKFSLHVAHATIHINKSSGQLGRELGNAVCSNIQKSATFF